MPCPKIYNKLDFANINIDIISGCAISRYTMERLNNLTMHDSCVNCPNYLKLCTENYATGKLNFAEQYTEFLLYANKHLPVTSRGI